MIFDYVVIIVGIPAIVIGIGTITYLIVHCISGGCSARHVLSSMGHSPIEVGFFKTGQYQWICEFCKKDLGVME